MGNVNMEARQVHFRGSDTYKNVQEAVAAALQGVGYVLPTASADTLGGVKVGSGLSIADGVLSANGYTLPTASDEVLGGVKVGSGLSIDENGVLSASGGGAGGAGQKYQTNVTLKGFIDKHAAIAGDELIFVPEISLVLETNFRIGGYDSTRVANATYKFSDIESRGFVLAECLMQGKGPVEKGKHMVFTLNIPYDAEEGYGPVVKLKNCKILKHIGSNGTARFEIDFEKLVVTNYRMNAGVLQVMGNAKAFVYNAHADGDEYASTKNINAFSGMPEIDITELYNDVEPDTIQPVTAQLHKMIITRSSDGETYLVNGATIGSNSGPTIYAPQQKFQRIPMWFQKNAGSGWGMYACYYGGLQGQTSGDGVQTELQITAANFDGNTPGGIWRINAPYISFPVEEVVTP